MTPKGLPPLQLSKIPHYYGNVVRVLFILVAILAAITIPIGGDLLPVGTITQVVGIVILVLLAGLTSPHGTTILWVDAIVSAIGVVVLETAAISYYSLDLAAIFLAREVLVLLLLIALYFSVKTVRAIVQHKLGHSRDVGEFTDSLDTEEDAFVQ